MHMCLLGCLICQWIFYMFLIISITAHYTQQGEAINAMYKKQRCTADIEQPKKIYFVLCATIYMFGRTFQNTVQAATATATMHSVLWDPHNGYYMAVVKRLLLTDNTYSRCRDRGHAVARDNSLWINMLNDTYTHIEHLHPNFIHYNVCVREVWTVNGILVTYFMWSTCVRCFR